MKKVLMMVLAAAMVLPFAGCKEQTAAEKAQDAIEQAGKDVQKGAEKAADAVEDAAKDVQKAAKDLTK